jgi:O-antigen/teichoic acid export membrane protein
MSLKRNILANYLGQAYAGVIGIIMLPVYLRHMGAEAYGLVGFFTMLQAWFQLLDLGLTPTLSRELSRYRAGIMDETQTATLVRVTEWFFGGLGVVGALAVGLAAGWIARDWLKPQHLSVGEMQLCVVLMAGMIAPRWLVGLYRGGLAGLEQMVSLNVAGIALATLRFVGVLAVLLLWTTRPSGFFAYQLGVAFVELAVIRMLFYRAFSMRTAAVRPRFQTLRSVLGVAGSMAFLAGLWVVISQTDKLVLSWILSLQSYGFFVVAVTLAGGISLLAGPMTQALQPRFAVLFAQGEQAALVKLYRTATQMTTAVVFAIAGVLACFAEPVLRAWTGSVVTAREAARILPLYALGNAVATLLVLAFLVQFAFGKLRWHVLGNCLFSLIWIPGVYLAARQAGAVGAGWVWLGGNLAYLCFWLPYVHRRLLPGLWRRWLLGDVGLIVLAEGVVLLGLARLDLSGLGRVGVGLAATLVTGVLVLAGLLAGGETRRAGLNLAQVFLGPNSPHAEKT